MDADEVVFVRDGAEVRVVELQREPRRHVHAREDATARRAIHVEPCLAHGEEGRERLLQVRAVVVRAKLRVTQARTNVRLGSGVGGRKDQCRRGGGEEERAHGMILLQ